MQSELRPGNLNRNLRKISAYKRGAQNPPFLFCAARTLPRTAQRFASFLFALPRTFHTLRRSFPCSTLLRPVRFLFRPHFATLFVPHYAALYLAPFSPRSPLFPRTLSPFALHCPATLCFAKLAICIAPRTVRALPRTAPLSAPCHPLRRPLCLCSPFAAPPRFALFPARSLPCHALRSPLFAPPALRFAPPRALHLPCPASAFARTPSFLPRTSSPFLPRAARSLPCSALPPPPRKGRSAQSLKGKNLS